MAILNRTEDVSEQRKSFVTNLGATATGVTAPIMFVPWPCTLDACEFAAFGVSGSPTYQLVVERFIPGSGFTAFSVGSANAVAAFGTSGVTGASLPASGSTLLNLMAFDVIEVLTAGSASAVTNISIGVVLKPIQDVKIQFGV